MHWFFKFLLIVFATFLVAYNLPVVDSALLTLDVAGIVGYVLAVVIVLVAVVRAGLGQADAGGDVLGGAHGAVMGAVEHVGKHVGKYVAARLPETAPVEEVNVYGGNPDIHLSNATRSYARHKTMAQKTRCACGAWNASRCMCDLQKKHQLTRGVAAQKVGVVPALLYSFALENKVVNKRISCILEVQGLCLDLKLDLGYGHEETLQNIACRPVRLLVTSAQQPTWFNLPYSEINRNMAFAIYEDGRGLFVVYESAQGTSVIRNSAKFS